MEYSKSLGEGFSNQFECGDVVSWKRLGEEGHTGMIFYLYTIELGGRKIKKARVASFKDSYDHEMLIMELKLVSKAR